MLTHQAELLLRQDQTWAPLLCFNGATIRLFLQRFCWGRFLNRVVSPQVSERLSQPGVAIGLAWTPLGGEIMFVEASRMDGEGQLTLTGQLGDVMKESAHLAISWLRSNAKRYQLTNGTWPTAAARVIVRSLCPLMQGCMLILRGN